MPMTDKIKADLEKEEPSDFLMQMLKDCRQLVDRSRRKMSGYYAQWDRNQEIFEGLMATDKEDKKAQERKEPERFVVPISFSQVMTFVSFCYAMYTQRERIFELVGMSEEDHKPAKIGEAFLARDLSFNAFEHKLFQFLLDIGRFSLGIYKCSWVRETQMARVVKEEPLISMFGFGLGRIKTESMEEVVKYLGNRVMNISPYRFFPDTRLPLTRFQEGEFVASEDDYSITSLKQLEHEGVIAGVDFIKSFSARDFETRQMTRTSDDFLVDAGAPRDGAGQSQGMTIVTEVQRTLIPSKYMVNGKPMGKEDYPVKYLVWYANDSRVIRCEPLNYLHGDYTYTMSQFTPDQHNLISMSLSDTIDMLQSTLSWFINSHITSVRKVISNMLIVDPNGVEMKDIQERKSIIRLKAGAPGGIDRYVKQIEVSDVTSNHLRDVEVLERLIQVTTGISENLMGQFHPGRRSATEARNVNSGAVARLKMQASIIYRTGIEPLAKQMLSNLRDGLDESTMVRLVGLEPTAESGPLFTKADKQDLVGNYDFEIFDGTLPSEKSFVAQALQEVLTALIARPEAAIALGMDPKKMLMEALELRGVRNPERFTLLPPSAVPAQNATGNTNGQTAAPVGAENIQGQSLLSLLSGGVGGRGETTGEGGPAALI